ncbi:MAG TPA: hypothetical protein PLV92_03810, partial [Pirellulaceae bacterium]|nr:hypothetical protein [Pirellulaceae bacterium]
MRRNWVKRAILALAMASTGMAATGAATTALGQTPSNRGDWPQWRGPNRDGISLETGLLKEWP